MSLWEVIWSNLLGFDLLIFVAAVLTGVCYFFTRLYADKLYQKLHMVIFVPAHQEKPEAVAEAVRGVDEDEFVSLRKRSESLYSLYMNLTSIFPLLGILGTVVSLLPMVNDMANMQQNFFAALTSTFWGLIFAIIFKMLDGLLASRIEDNDKNVSMLLERRASLKEGGAK
ncbi:MAG: MotA/TolQ/ExbB proton channel family protein [Lachnospiraceae bacterium]|nr:MotA/TolQ/ExbB proton channel family protein [Lachnospiraceae bacterium]